MKREAIERIVAQWITAFNTRDLDGLLALYDPTAVHNSPNLARLRPEMKGEIRGTEALRDWRADAFRRLPSLEYRLRRLIIDEEGAVMVYLRKVENEPWRIVRERLQIQDDKIIASYVYAA